MKQKEVLDREVAYRQSIEILRKCSSEYGFTASGLSKGNYGRVWGRDSMICSLAALLSGEDDLIIQVKKSLNTLMNFQYKHGQIPSNVDVKKKKVSYGGSVGRVDATLWFIIGFSQYVKRTKDMHFLKVNYEKLKKAESLIHLYEFNDKSLIYVPRGGDWADEYVQEGYVLYDNLLYYQAIKEHMDMRKKLGKKTDELKKKLAKVRKSIKVNYWPKKRNSKFIYNKILYNRIRKDNRYHKPYFLPYFNTSKYGDNFDGFANSLAILFGFAKGGKKRKIIRYIEDNFGERGLIPSFWPPITDSDEKWADLKDNYSIKFRNHPYEYHNGGFWPMITGFYAASISRKKRKALRYLDGINFANYQSQDKMPYGFYEFLNSKTFEAKGIKYQGWSGAAGVIAYHTILKRKKLFI